MQGLTFPVVPLWIHFTVARFFYNILHSLHSKLTMDCYDVTIKSKGVNHI